MNSPLKAQTAAIIGILALALLGAAPWLVGSHLLQPKGEEFRRIIRRKDDLLIQQEQLRQEVQGYDRMPEKKEANGRFQKCIDQTSLDAIQGCLNNGKFPITGFKTVALPDTKEDRFSFLAPYNTLGQLLTELWNTFPFLEVSSVVLKPSPNKPDEDVLATLTVRMPGAP